MSRDQHSGRASSFPALAATVLAVVGACPLAWLYALGLIELPWMFLCVFLAIAFGSVLCHLTVWTLRLAKVRSKQTATGAAFVVTAIAFYVAWAAWAAMRLQYSGVETTTLDMLAQPQYLLATVWEANSVAVWTIRGVEIKGALLAVVWVLEAATIFLLGAAGAVVSFQDVPFCQACGTWCAKHKNVARFWDPDRDLVERAIKAKDLDRLASLEPVPLKTALGVLGRAQWYECDLKTCPKCSQTITLDVHHVTASRSLYGMPRQSYKPVVDNLVLTPVEADGFRNLAARQAPTDASTV